MPFKKQHVCFLVILALWILGSQEMYLNKNKLTDAVSTRYIIYFFWLLCTASIGYYAWFRETQLWPKQLWLLIYGAALLVLLTLGLIDRSIMQFSMNQKAYIQTFRLFFQSPAPFVMMYLFIKLSRQAGRSTTSNLL